jgi:WD40 repeat protein
MKAPSPDTLKQVKDVSRQVITLAIGRVPDSERAFLGSSDSKVYEVDFAAAKPEPKEAFGHESGYVTGVAVALGGEVVVSGGYDGKLVWFDPSEKKVIRTTAAHAKWIRRVVPSPDGKLVASIADDMACKLWDAATGKLVRELRGHQAMTPHNFHSMLYTVAFSADGYRLVTGDKVGHVVVWDVESGKPLTTCESPGMYTWDPVQRLHSIGGIRSLAFSPDGTRLAVGGMGKVGNIDHLEGKARLEVFELNGDAPGKSVWVSESDKFKGLVTRLQFAPDGSWLLGAGGAGEGFLMFWDVAAKKVLRQEKVGTHVHDFALNEEGDTIYSVGHNRVLVHKLG